MVILELQDRTQLNALGYFVGQQIDYRGGAIFKKINNKLIQYCYNGNSLLLPLTVVESRQLFKAMAA